jgi:hypothetical protein
MMVDMLCSWCYNETFMCHVKGQARRDMFSRNALHNLSLRGVWGNTIYSPIKLHVCQCNLFCMVLHNHTIVLQRRIHVLLLLHGTTFEPNTRLGHVQPFTNSPFPSTYCLGILFFCLTKTSTNIWPTLCIST